MGSRKSVLGRGSFDERLSETTCWQLRCRNVVQLLSESVGAILNNLHTLGHGRVHWNGQASVDTVQAHINGGLVVNAFRRASLGKAQALPFSLFAFGFGLDYSNLEDIACSEVWNLVIFAAYCLDSVSFFGLKLIDEGFAAVHRRSREWRWPVILWTLPCLKPRLLCSMLGGVVLNWYVIRVIGLFVKGVPLATVRVHLRLSLSILICILFAKHLGPSVLCAPAISFGLKGVFIF